jgi:hypothetical protein
MKWFLLFWLIFWGILLLSNVKIIIRYEKTEKDDDIHIQFNFLFGLIKFTFNIPMVKLTSLINGVKVKGGVGTETPQEDPALAKKSFLLTPERFKSFLEFISTIKVRVHDMNEITKKTLSKVRCEKLEWSTNIGIGDAAATGVAAGFLWGIKSAFIGLLSHYIALQTSPKINVTPVFKGSIIATRFLVVFKFRLINSTIAISRILFRYLRGRLRLVVDKATA